LNVVLDQHFEEAALTGCFSVIHFTHFLYSHSSVTSN